MITQYDLQAKVWVTAGRGYLRPIITEAHTRRASMEAYVDVINDQKDEEYAFEQSMSHLTDQMDGETYGEDLG